MPTWWNSVIKWSFVPIHFCYFCKIFLAITRTRAAEFLLDDLEHDSGMDDPAEDEPLYDQILSAAQHA